MVDKNNCILKAGDRVKIGEVVQATITEIYHEEGDPNCHKESARLQIEGLPFAIDLYATIAAEHFEKI